MPQGLTPSPSLIPLANRWCAVVAVFRLPFLSRCRMRRDARPFAKRKEGSMSLHPHTIDPIPEQTARIAHAAFRRGNPVMRMRDEVGTLFTDEAFAPLFPARGRPVVSPWRLALVCVMQYVESLSDRQAAEAVRVRIDWKYALSLALDDPGFD